MTFAITDVIIAGLTSECYYTVDKTSQPHLLMLNHNLPQLTRLKKPRLLTGWLAAFVMIVCAGSLVVAQQSKPNVLFIAVDDLRTDIGCFGNTEVKTPNIDALAKRGLVFHRAYCQQAVCSPSRTSLLTGLRPDSTKVYDLVTHFRNTVPDVISLPQHFRESGYYTVGMGKSITRVTTIRRVGASRIAMEVVRVMFSRRISSGWLRMKQRKSF